MKHIKKVKTSIATLILGENQIHRIPVVAMYLRPPKGMIVSSWDEEGNGIIPRYDIVDIIPVNDEAESTLVDLVFSERILPEEIESAPVNFMVTVPIHAVVLMQSLSLINESFNLVVLDAGTTPMNELEAIELQNIAFSINFPDNQTERYQDLLDKLSTLIDAQFVEPLHSSFVANTGFNAVSMPLRRAQMAIMPIISALSQNDPKALARIIALESTLDNFHLRNHNQNPDVKTGEYSRVVESMENSEDYVVPEIPEDIEYMSTFEYSVLDNMTDAMENYMKVNESNSKDRMYYKDLTLLILLTNMKAVYENSEGDEFLTHRTVTEEESCTEYGAQLHRDFMSLIEDGLGDTFDDIDIDKVEKTEIELELSSNIESWNKSPEEYWPENMEKVEAELKSSSNSKAYFDIMKRSYSTPEEFSSLVTEYGLGKVFTSLVLKTAINLSKYTSIIHKNDIDTPSTLIAMHWINQPDDNYLWELPALSYDLSSYDVSTFVSLLKYVKNNFAGYLGVALQGLAVRIIAEGWEKTNLEWHLSEYTGMPEKYQKMLLSLVGEIDDVEIDPREIDIHGIESKEELDEYVATKGIESFVTSHTLSIEDNAYMVAYAFPALADIYVQTLPPFPPELEGDDEKKIIMGSTEWKKHRVNYIENMLDSIVDKVERKAI